MSYRKPYFLGAASVVLAAVALRAFSAGIPPPSQPEPARTPEHSGPSSDGRYLFEWESDPDPLPLNQDFSLRVRVRSTGPQGDARGLKLLADARMPEHDHGMLQAPRVTELAPGEFLVEGMRFHMPGRWVIRLELQGKQRSALETSIHVDP